jgi:RHS repeat-associated protein
LTNATATDHTGITLNADAGQSSLASWSTTLPNGYENFSVGSVTFQADANGNEITAATPGPVYTDTLGTTVLTLGGGSPPTATTFKYTAPSGALATYTVSYHSYTVTTNFGCSGISEFTQSNVNLVDRITLPDSTYYQFQYEQTAGAGANVVTGRLTSITLPTGGSITYAYPLVSGGTKNGINCADGTAPTGSSSLTRTVSPGGTWTYARTQVSGKHWQTTVSTPPDPTTPNQTVIDFQQDSNSTGNFYETQRQVYQGSTSGTLLSTAVTCYNGFGTLTPSSTYCQPSTAVSSPPTRLTSFICLSNCSGKVAETDVSYGYISVPGYQTEVDSYDYGAGGPPSSPLRKVVTAYSIFGPIVRPTSAQVKDASNNVKASTTYSYDETAVTTTTGTPNLITPVGGASRGNLTTIATQASGTVTLYRKFTYFDTGNLRTATDAGTTSTGGPNTTTYTYGGCTNSLLTSVAAPLSLSRSFTWDCTGGVQTSVTDENSKTSTVYFAQTSTYGSPDTQYWRPYATTDPLSNATTLSYPSATVAESAMLFNSNNSVVDQRSKVDVFGRPYLSQVKEGPSSTTYDSTETDYDALGRPQKSVLPFTASADTACTGVCSGVTTTYDALYRLLTRTDGGGGSVSFTYTANDTLQVNGPPPTGENTKRRQYEYNGLGWLSWVCEVTSASGSGACGTGGPTGFWTKYTYDVNGNMTGVTQNAQAASGSQQTRTYVFDMIGRITSETNPETGSSAITYVYDKLTSDASCGTVTSAGDLLKRTDAKGNVTCYTYDGMHRVTNLAYSGPDSASSPTKTFVYDSATFNGTAMSNPKGRRVEAYTGASGAKVTDEFFSYSARGELTDVWQCTPHSGTNGCASVSNYYHLTTAYWANGAVSSLGNNIIGLPSQSYGVDGMGRTSTVSASSGQNPVTATSRSLSSSMYSVTFGSGDTDTFYTDPNTGRQTKYVFNVNGATNTGQTNWNQNGSLGSFQITDNISGTGDTQTCNYTHDDLARIASVNCANGGTNKWNQNFSFDAFGNISKIVPGGGTGVSFQPTYATSSNWITALPGVTPTTDPAGRMTYDGSHTYTWDAESKLVGVDSTTITYDALGRTVEKNVSGTYTQIVYGTAGNKFATMTGQTLVKALIPLPAAVAVYTSSGLAYYRHRDHLGSSRLATTPSRTMYASTAYGPYGEPYAQTGTTDLSFTGQDQDTTSGMYDFLNRRYNPVQGRWLSPDPAGSGAVDPTNPQTWNRYAYVLNNPLQSTDPLGLECVWDDGSYDSENDKSTGNVGSCQQQGGTWVELGQGGDWNPIGNNQLATAVGQILNGQINTLGVIGKDGSVNITQYGAVVNGTALVSATDTGGMITQYGYNNVMFGPNGTVISANVGSAHEINSMLDSTGQVAILAYRELEAQQYLQDPTWQGAHYFDRPMFTSCEFALTYLGSATLGAIPPVAGALPAWANWGLWGSAAGTLGASVYVC